MDTKPDSAGAAVERGGHASPIHGGRVAGADRHRRRALPALRLGLSYQPGFDWSMPFVPPPGAAPATVDVRRPSLLSAGIAWRQSTTGPWASRETSSATARSWIPCAAIPATLRTIGASPTRWSRVSGSSSQPRSGAAAASGSSGPASTTGRPASSATTGTTRPHPRLRPGPLGDSVHDGRVHLRGVLRLCPAFRHRRQERVPRPRHLPSASSSGSEP